MAKRNDKIAEDDFDSLERLAQSVTPQAMRPMSPEMRRRWGVAKRGRPRKAPGAKSVPTMIMVEPQLLKRIDAEARKAGLSRSGFIAEAVRRYVYDAA